MSHINRQDYFKIVLFDDGNEGYMNVPNKWIMLEFIFNREKVKIKNFHRPDLVIDSIPTWKLEYIGKID